MSEIPLRLSVAGGDEEALGGATVDGEARRGVVPHSVCWRTSPLVKRPYGLLKLSGLPSDVISVTTHHRIFVVKTLDRRWFSKLALRTAGTPVTAVENRHSDIPSVMSA